MKELAPLRDRLDHVARFLLMLVLTLSVACGEMPASAAGQEVRRLDQLGMRGNVGEAPIAMIATLDEQHTLVDIHYSYASRGEKIPLTAAVDGSVLTLTEPGGGKFDLHFVSHGTARQDGPLGFYTATGLEGRWKHATRELPVRIQFVQTRDVLEDCIFYPDPVFETQQPHFPAPGCEHTPDKAALDACIASPFVSDQATIECAKATLRPCRFDQFNQNFCTSNLSSYLDQVIESRLRQPATSSMTEERYPAWSKAARTSCEHSSEFGSDGSGHGADVVMCIAYEQLRLLQRHLEPASQPIRRTAQH